MIQSADDRGAASSAPARSGVLHRLARLRFVHVLLHKLGAYWLLNRVLRRFPFQRRLDGGNIIRLSSITSFVLAEELFAKGAYAEALHGFSINTFADLGGNVGWFPCYLAEQTGRRDLGGVIIEADPDLVPEIEWHLEANELVRCKCVWGAVGCTGVDEVEFHINP